MITRILLISTLALTSMLSAAELSSEDRLRQGLYEEEANRDFVKAAESYRAVIAAHDRQRSLAATATFRLGEIARKKNDKEAAAAAFRTVAERFPEQTDLARLSRENLSALGMSTIVASEAPPAAQTTDAEEIEIARLQATARNSPDLLDGANEIGWRPIHLAAEKGQMKVLTYLLKNKADPNGRTTKGGLTPLHLASIHGHLAVVNALLAAKADLDQSVSMLGIAKTLPTMERKAENVGGDWSALDFAVLYDRREIAKTLIKAGAAVKRFGPSPDQSCGYTTLLTAIYLGRDELAQALIDAGSPLEEVAGQKAPSPLSLAVNCGSNMVAPLLKAGANPNLSCKMAAGRSPLLIAASENHVEIAKLLLAAGADVRATDSQGATALHFVSSPEMVDLLVAKGAEVNAVAKELGTPLDVFATGKTDSIPTLEALLRHGATTLQPKALLERTSKDFLSIIQKKVVYPKEQRPDAILISFDNSLSEGRGASLVTLETRPSLNTTPPTLAEALSEAAINPNSFIIHEIHIQRRSGGDRFETVREWKRSQTEVIPTDWPALAWGDILEVQTQNRNIGGRYSPKVWEFEEKIPNRTVTVLVGDFSYPQLMSGKNGFSVATSANAETRFLGISDLVDFSRFTVRRKGADKPIHVTLTDASFPKFRFIDGDTVELTLDPKKSRADVVTLHWFAEGGTGARYANDLVKALVNSAADLPKGADLSYVAVLRKAGGGTLERLDIGAWLDQLPPREQWSIEEITDSAPKVQLGDVILLFPTPDEKAAVKSAAIRAKLLEIANSTPQRRPRLAPQR